MSAHVLVQIVLSGKGLPARRAHVVFNAAVNFLVLLEIAANGKSFLAIAARERFLLGVGPHVCEQMAGLSECFGADITCIRLLSGMDSDMVFERFSIAETLATGITFVGFFVYMFMSSTTSAGVEISITESAFELDVFSAIMF